MTVPSPSIASGRIRFTIREEVGVDRSDEIVSLALALPPGLLPASGTPAIGIRTQSGALVPSQCRMLQGWPDGSVRWLGIRAQISLPADGQASYHLTDQPANPSTPEARARSERDSVHLTNAWHAFTIQPNEPFILTSPNGINSRLIVRDLDGRAYYATVDSVEVEEPGPVWAGARVVGQYRDDQERSLFDFEARVHLSAGSPVVTADLRIINREDSASTAAGGWAFELRAPGVVAARCGVHDAVHQTTAPFSIRHTGRGHMRGVFTTGEIHSDDDVWLDASPASYWSTWEWAELHERQATNWIDLTLPRDRHLAVVLRRAAEDHPSDLTFTGTGLHIGLWPRWAGELRLTQGAAKTRRVLLHEAPAAPDDHGVGLRAETPLISWQPDAASLCRLPLAPLPYLPETYPHLEVHIRGELASWYSKGQALGFFDHGDDMTEHQHGPRSGFSANNEHDALFALCQHYLRTGERATYDSAEAYANHLIDIDLIHHSTQNTFESGGIRAHGRDHVHYSPARTSEGPVRTSVDTGHMWVEGLLLFGALSNDTRYLDAARGIGDCLTRLTALGWSKPEPGPRNAGWPLIALTALATWYPESDYLDTALRISDVAMQAQTDDGQWLMRVGRARRGSAWQSSVLLTGLARVHALAPDERLEQALTRGFRALLTAGRHRDGSFVNYDRFDYAGIYESGLVREALAAGHRLLGVPELLQAGLAGGNRWYRFTRGSVATNNGLADWRGHLPFLACAHEAGMLSDMVPS